MKKARIIGGVAVDVSIDPENHFHSDVAAQFVSVPDHVEPGWVIGEDGAWSAPALAPEKPIPQEFAKVSPVEFMLLFNSAERVGIKGKRASDPVIDDFMGIVEDPRLSHVDLGLQSTQDALSYFVAIGILTEERRTEILSGKVLK